MFAVVQIGSKILRSPCSTARTVRALLGADCACSRPGADMAAAGATVPLTNVRRDVVIGSPPRAAHQHQREPGSFIAFFYWIDLGMASCVRQAQSEQTGI